MGGTIDGPNAALVLGENHSSALTISNGVAVFQDGFIGFTHTGTFAQAGGTLTVLSNLLVGDCANNATGTATLDGGELFVTNAAHTAVLNVRKGSFTLTSGSLTADKLIITNACGGTFNRSGGTLTYGELILAPAGDADGDGLPNSWEQAHGLDPLSTAGVNGASGDADGDGMTNLQEFQAGTNPTLNLTGIAREGDGVRVSWSMGGLKDSVLQVSPDLTSGSFTNLFTVLAGAASATNYLDVGAVPNAPARFYRVRLVP